MYGLDTLHKLNHNAKGAKPPAPWHKLPANATIKPVHSTAGAGRPGKSTKGI